MEVLGRLRWAVKKLTFLLNLKKFLTSSTWQVASLIRARTPVITRRSHWRRRAYSFSDRPGLRACVDVVVVVDHHHTDNDDDANYDAEEEDNGRRWGGCSGTSSPYTLERTTSCPLELDIDKNAEAFIDNFYRHLVYEKQVSLELRYCQHASSSLTSSDTIVSPFSSFGSPTLSPT